MANSTIKETVNNGIVTMLPLIIAAHNSNNLAAISEDEATDAGVTDQSFAQWLAYVEDLRQVTIEYHDLSLAKNAKVKDLEIAEGAVFAMWKDVLKQADVKKISKHWFVRKTDAAWMLACLKKNVRSAKGSLQGHKSKTEFRREIERLIGCRLASNKVLSDDQQKLIVKYELAENTIERQTDALNGKGKKVGLLKEHEKANEKLAEKTKLVEALGGTAEQQATLLASDKLAVKEIKKAIKTAQTSIKEAKEYIADNKEAYDKLMETIKEIEG